MRQRVVIVAMFLLIGSVSCAGDPELPTATPTLNPLMYEDCVAPVTVSVWEEENSNGIWDEDEAPLPNVVIIVDDVLNDYESVGYLVSDSSGVAEESIRLPGCPDVEFELRAFPPRNYHLTTDGSTDRFGFVYSPRDMRPTPRPSSQIDCVAYPLDGSYLDAKDILVEPNGAVWVMSRTVARYDPTTQIISSYPIQENQQRNITSAQLGPEGSIWVGTNLEGLFRFDGKSWEQFKDLSNSGDADLDFHDIVDFATLDDGTLIVSSVMNGVSRFDPAANRWEAYDVPGDLSAASTVVGADGTVWVFDRTTIYQLIIPKDDEPTWLQLKTEADRFGELQFIAGAIAEDGQNIIWFWGTTETNEPALVRFDPVGPDWQTYSHQLTGGDMPGGYVTDLFAAADGSVWAGLHSSNSAGREGGLLHFDPLDDTSGQWSFYTTESGLLSNIVSRILIDNSNNLWIVHDKGVSQCLLP